MDSRLERMAGMTPDEINRQVAEKVMGWGYSAWGRNHYVEIIVSSDISSGNQQDETFVMQVESWQPYTNIEQAMMMQKEIHKKGLARKYTNAFFNIIEPEGTTLPDDELVWAMIHATPQQRCEAALKAVGL